jgi:hypothetical protein
MIGIIWNLYFPVLHERTLVSTAGAQRRAGNCPLALVGGSSLSSPPLLSVEPKNHINDQHTNFHFGKFLSFSVKSFEEERDIWEVRHYNITCRVNSQTGTYTVYVDAAFRV